MSAKNPDVDAAMRVIAQHAQQGEEKLSLATERLLKQHTGEDYEAFRQMTGQNRSAFTELVLDAYEQCAIAERRALETVEQATRTLTSFVQLIELRNSVDAERIRSATNQTNAAAADFEAKYEMFKLILTRYREPKEMA